MKLRSEQQRFFYRVAGVVVHDGRVLTHKDDESDFWVLPGGSCEFGEDSMSCLAREFREELDADVQVGRLLWVVENFFRFRGWECHDLRPAFLKQHLADMPDRTISIVHRDTSWENP